MHGCMSLKSFVEMAILLTSMIILSSSYIAIHIHSISTELAIRNILLIYEGIYLILTCFIQLHSHIQPVINKFTVNLSNIFDHSCQLLWFQIIFRFLHLHKNSLSHSDLFSQALLSCIRPTAVTSLGCQTSKSSFQLQTGGTKGGIHQAHFAGALLVCSGMVNESGILLPVLLPELFAGGELEVSSLGRLSNGRQLWHCPRLHKEVGDRGYQSYTLSPENTRQDNY